MASLLNPHRPPAFCPGCSHERTLAALDEALTGLGLIPSEVALVSDIGCSGLFDTFFQTHALHGLHGRALTYAAGLKLAQPHLHVIVTMGDGGLGIGGAHLLAACRRNLDLTLLVLNNFNFGMTGGQFSCTTPKEAVTGSGFLNNLEQPMDVCTVAAAAGAPFVARCSVHGKDLPSMLSKALSFHGFSLVDVWGICTGRYRKRNPITPQVIETRMSSLHPFAGPVADNARPEFGDCYRAALDRKDREAFPRLQPIEPIFSRLPFAKREVVLMGAAGDRVLSAGTILAHAAMLSGMQATQKNDYPITVLRGPSVSEVIVASQPIVFTGVDRPDVMIALAAEGVARRRDLFARMRPEGWILSQTGVEIPASAARLDTVDLRALGFKRADWALAALAILARRKDPLTPEMLNAALHQTLKGDALRQSLRVVERIAAGIDQRESSA